MEHRDTEAQSFFIVTSMYGKYLIERLCASVSLCSKKNILTNYE